MRKRFRFTFEFTADTRILSDVMGAMTRGLADSIRQWVSFLDDVTTELTDLGEVPEIRSETPNQQRWANIQAARDSLSPRPTVVDRNIGWDRRRRPKFDPAEERDIEDVLAELEQEASDKLPERRIRFKKSEHKKGED